MSRWRERALAPAAARGAVVLAGALLVLALPGWPAAAHAVLVGSDPADGATLARAPRSVELRFGEAISPRFSSAQLVDRGGRPVAGAAVAARRGDPRRLVLELPALRAGAYAVLWQALAENDGHVTRGVVVFNVGAASGPPAAPASFGQPAGAGAPQRAGALDVTRRWVGLCLLAGLVGALAVALALGLARPRRLEPPLDVPVRLGLGDPEAAARPLDAPAWLGLTGPARSGRSLADAIRSARRRLLAFAGACAALAAAAHLVDAAVEAARQAPAAEGFWASLGRLLTGTRWGQLWLVREAALLALALVLARLAAAPGRPVQRVAPPGRRLRAALGAAAAALLLAVVVAEAAGSHAWALESGRGVAVAADALHILTACVWLGMLPALLLLLWHGRGAGGQAGELLRASRGPLSLLAAASVGLVVVTGLYEAGREVDAVSGLSGTTYGRALLAKGALLLVAGGLGVANMTRLHGWRLAGRGPRARRAAPLSRRLVAAEAAVGALLLVAVGLLVESVPARGPNGAPPVASAQATGEARTGSAVVADLVVSVSVTPNRPGVNGFTVLAASSRRPPPAPIDGAALRLVQGGAKDSVALQQVAPGRWFGTGRLGRAGRVRLTAVVHRGRERVAAPLSWRVEPPAQAASPAPPASRRLAPIVDGAALALLAGAAAGTAAWLLLARRRRRRAVPVVHHPTQPADRVLEGMR
ncbi:MAG TPA: copper resistance CopC family protein [Actinomycetes bacterium]